MGLGSVHRCADVCLCESHDFDADPDGKRPRRGGVLISEDEMIGEGKSGSVIEDTTAFKTQEEIAKLTVDKAEILHDVVNALYQLSMGLKNNAEQILRDTTRKHI